MPASGAPAPTSTGGPLLADGVTVLANLAIDRIEGRAPSAGGCPSFAPAALEPFGAGRIVARGASGDLALFEQALTAGAQIAIDLLPAAVTAGFGLWYRGDDRTMTVDAVGPVWEPADVAAAQIQTRWVHVSPLLRSDFPARTIAALAAAGHCIALDGQGLVRVPEVGPMRVDGAFDDGILEHVSVLKLADDEAGVLTGGAEFDDAFAQALGVPEILVTLGSHGCDLFVAGRRQHVPPAWRVDAVHTTGAGDMFTVAYVAARARGDEPALAAATASRVVAEMLQVRAAALD